MAKGGIKVVKLDEKSRKKILHVETSLGIVNIYTGLSDTEGRRVEAIGIIPNGSTGEKQVRVVLGTDEKEYDSLSFRMREEKQND